MKNKIVIFCSPSSAGKDSLLKEFVSLTDFKFVTSHTSRPVRENESEGNPYYFVSKDEFLSKVKNNEFIEFREYHTLVDNKKDVWYYGVDKNEIDLSKHNYAVILDIVGIVDFIKHFGRDRLEIFYIHVDDLERKNRAMKRGSFDHSEWNRRLEDDKRVFCVDNLNKHVDHIVYNDNFNNCLKNILEIVGK